jgi:hypothetical protein
VQFGDVAVTRRQPGIDPFAVAIGQRGSRSTGPPVRTTV